MAWTIVEYGTTCVYRPENTALCAGTCGGKLVKQTYGTRNFDTKREAQKYLEESHGGYTKVTNSVRVWHEFILVVEKVP